jgi:hypothetical protein
MRNDATRRFLQLPGALSRCVSLQGFISLCILILCVSVAYGEEVLLNATFDDKTIDAQIGMGGAAVGEPSSMDANMQAIVRAAPFSTPCLEVGDLTTTGGTLVFMLPAQVNDGLVTVATDLWFYPEFVCVYSLYLRNHWNQSVTMVEFAPNGTAMVWDMNGGAVENVPYARGQVVPLRIAVDLDARTYTVTLDGVIQVQDRPLYAQISDIDGLRFTAGAGCQAGNRFSIDAVGVLHRPSDTPVERMTWGRLRALYR